MALAVCYIDGIECRKAGVRMRDDAAVLTGCYTGEAGGESLFLAPADASSEGYIEEFLGAPA
jgi:hypothetical protein